MTDLIASRLLSVALLCLAIAAPAAADAPEPPPAPTADVAADLQVETYERFRTLYETGDFAAALPLAQQVVELTETDPDRDIELPIAYNNLGATQLRLGDLAAAEASYLTSLDMLEKTQAISSRRLIAPLAGLGSVYAARGLHSQAVERLARAVAISRRAEGLFNLGQMPLLDPLITSYQELGDLASVDYERRYVTQIAEQSWGFGDPRTIPSLSQLAVWFEQTRRYASARALYMRIRDLSLKEGGARNPATINALLGIGRTYRLQYMVDPDSLTEAEYLVDPRTGQRTPWVVKRNPVGPKLDREGQRALEQALATLKATADPPPRLLVNTEIELGDWFMVVGRYDEAIEHYRAAWNAMPDALAENEVNPLLQPRLIFYRPPDASIRSREVPDRLKRVQTAELLAIVDEKGRVTEAEVMPGEMPDLLAAQFRRALRSAIYSPRFEDGQPVPTSGVQFVGEWHFLLENEPPTETDSGS